MNRSIKVIGAVLGIILLILVGWQLRGIFFGTDPITKAEASEMVKAQYKGEVLTVSEDKDMFVMTMELDDNQYEVKVNQETGEIANLVRISKGKDKTEQKLSEKEIREIVRENQQGDIKSVEEKQEKGQSFYYAVVQSETEKTIVKLESATGKVIDKVTEKIPDKETMPTPQEQAKKLTEKEATKIALQKVQGKLDDVELEELNGVSYYLVEIEREDEQEATVQINSISGEVISIVWDE
ncbi:PepSY domain-containing protein [Bacillus seohaeanensis]|jgi:uncharacterized membrane protein YkoI|uniref:PepSY domain-containing protein n=1 Tax=Bacillus seohaeanensis TaxID=284580 RepID=A0ABW5RNV2_9BACI